MKCINWYTSRKKKEKISDDISEGGGPHGPPLWIHFCYNRRYDGCVFYSRLKKCRVTRKFSKFHKKKESMLFDYGTRRYFLLKITDFSYLVKYATTILTTFLTKPSRKSTLDVIQTQQ